MRSLSPRLRNLALTAHVTSSVGWMGAVAGFLALAVAGLTSERDQMVRAAYLAMELTGWFVIVPLSLAALVTGIVQSLGTPWGLFRHYWVVAKLLITVIATALLLLHMQPTSRLAAAAAGPRFAGAELRPLQVQLVADAVAALAVLLVATALAVYKPSGMTAYGRRQQRQRLVSEPRSGADISVTRPRWVNLLAIVVLVLVALFFVLHLLGRGLGGH